MVAVMVVVVVVVVVRRLVLVVVSAVLLQLLLRLFCCSWWVVVMLLPVPAGGVPLPGDAARAACSELRRRWRGDGDPKSRLAKSRDTITSKKALFFLHFISSAEIRPISEQLNSE